MMMRYGANVSPCSTPATMLKETVSRSGERTLICKRKSSSIVPNIALFFSFFFLCFFSYLPSTHECGTRPFLRWARSQGRSPHASGKAKSTFGPVEGYLRRQALPPKGGESLGGLPPEAGGTLQCRGTPGRNAQRYDSLPNATQQLKRKAHKHLIFTSHLFAHCSIIEQFHFKKVKFTLSHSFALILNVKQFCLIQ